MIQIKESERVYQRCISCYKEEVKAVIFKIEDSTNSQTIHLCSKCLNSLGELITKELRKPNV